MDYEKLLTEYGLWPMKKWNNFEFAHQPPSDEAERLAQRGLLHRAVGDAQGIYAYRKGSEWLYVGKGNPINYRLRNHYRAAYETVPGDGVNNHFHQFFSAHQGRLTIYWSQIGLETDRCIFELALKELLNPLFNH